jgi:hypothetical protein
MHPKLTKLLVLSLAATTVGSVSGRDLFDFFKKKPNPGQTSTAPTVVSLTDLSSSQIAQGLKEALDKGVQQAISNLGKKDGFLKNLEVKIPMPENLQTVEKTLRTLRQDKLADDFVATMNRAAEKAVPEAAAVLGDAIKQMSIADAKAILTGTNNAATEYFRRTSETNLFVRFRPLVQKATEETGVTRLYKQMMDKTSLAGGFSSLLSSKDTTDLDSYITRKALDGLFVMIAREEARIRENPVARTTDLLKKVFGAAGK